MNKPARIGILLISLILGSCAGSLAPGGTLEGTAWALTHIGGSPVLPGTSPSLRFEAGQVSGNGSCNRFSGEYTQRGDGLSFGLLMSTEMACLSPGVMEQEQAYLAALGSAAEFSLEGGALRIYDSSGTLLLSFSAQDASLTDASEGSIQ